MALPQRHDLELRHRGYPCPYCVHDRYVKGPCDVRIVLDELAASERRVSEAREQGARAVLAERRERFRVGLSRMTLSEQEVLSRARIEGLVHDLLADEPTDAP